MSCARNGAKIAHTAGPAAGLTSTATKFNNTFGVFSNKVLEVIDRQGVIGRTARHPIRRGAQDLVFSLGVTGLAAGATGAIAACPPLGVAAFIKGRRLVKWAHGNPDREKGPVDTVAATGPNRFGILTNTTVQVWQDKNDPDNRLFKIGRNTWEYRSSQEAGFDGHGRTLTRLASRTIPATQYYFDRPITAEQAVGIASRRLGATQVEGYVGQVSYAEAISPAWALTKHRMIRASVLSGAVSGQEPALRSQVADLVGTVSGYNTLLQRIKEANKAEAERRRVVNRKRAAIINSENRKKASVSLQTQFTGRSIKTSDLETGRLTVVSEPVALDDHTWMIDSDMGTIVYDKNGSGTSTLVAIYPTIGTEPRLVNRLSAFTSEAILPSPPEPATASTPPFDESGLKGKAQVAGRWVAAHQDELKAAAGTVAVPVALALATGGSHFHIGAVPLPLKPTSPVGAAATVALVAAGTYSAVRTAQRDRESKRVLAQHLKDPQRQQATIELQKKLVGTRVSEENLADVLNGRPRQISGDTWYIDGDLGTVYYNKTTGDHVMIQAIAPAVVSEIRLRNGLLTITQKTK